MKSVPSALVNGSPASSHPPMHASNSPNGLSVVDAPRRGDSYGILNIAESLVLSHGAPASRRSTLAPARVRTYAAIPPPAPDPTMQTSYVFRCATVRAGVGNARVIANRPLRTRESTTARRTALAPAGITFVYRFGMVF